MRFIILLIVLNLTFVKNTLAVQCSINNPCELGGYFIPPKYNCYQLANSPNDVLCTCPNGQGQKNTRCRVCDRINCGPNGVCFERDIFQGSFHFCGCSNGTGSYAIPGPCPTVTSTTTTTTTVITFLPISCLNGGIYRPAIGICECPTGFTGTQCEISIGQEVCRYITCANDGICNPVPTVNNGVSTECWCLNGFSGANCELIGNSGGCISGLCQNGGICEEKILGSSRFGYCQCSAGFTGRCCERQYFICPYSGLFPDSVNCKFGRYYECINTVPVIRSCPILGFHFNPLTMKCEFNAVCP